jgi:hypothetical protein
MATVRTSYNSAEYNRLSWRHFDVPLVLIVLALLTIGLLDQQRDAKLCRSGSPQWRAVRDSTR